MFVSDARETLNDLNRNIDFILNMDQPLIPFSFHGKQSLDSYVTHTVDICKSTGNMRYATFAETSELLMECLNQFSTFPKDAFYACQKNAWMDEHLMKAWDEQILKLFVSNALDGNVSILFLDMYHCHMMELVVSIIK